MGLIKTFIEEWNYLFGAPKNNDTKEGARKVGTATIQSNTVGGWYDGLSEQDWKDIGFEKMPAVPGMMERYCEPDLCVVCGKPGVMERGKHGADWYHKECYPKLVAPPYQNPQEAWAERVQINAGKQWICAARCDCGRIPGSWNRAQICRDKGYCGCIPATDHNHLDAKCRDCSQKLFWCGEVRHSAAPRAYVSGEKPKDDTHWMTTDEKPIYDGAEREQIVPGSPEWRERCERFPCDENWWFCTNKSCRCNPDTQAPPDDFYCGCVELTDGEKPERCRTCLSLMVHRDCVVERGSSRMCEYGTRGCSVVHKKDEPQRWGVPDKTPPPGLYGVFCEGKSGMQAPHWLHFFVDGKRMDDGCSYDEACKEADTMNRANKEWHYYAKPIPRKAE